MIINPVFQSFAQEEYKPIFSEPIYQVSDTVAPFKLCERTYQQGNPVSVFIFSLFLSIQADAPGTILNLIDRVNSRTVFSFNQLIANNGFYPLYIINKGNRFSLSIETAVPVIFTVGFLWVFSDKTPKEK